MKKLLLVIALLLIINTYAQEISMIETHIFNKAVKLQQTDFEGMDYDPTKSEIMEANWKFKIINQMNSDYVIQISKFT